MQLIRLGSTKPGCPDDKKLFGVGGMVDDGFDTFYISDKGMGESSKLLLYDGFDTQCGHGPITTGQFGPKGPPHRIEGYGATSSMPQV